MSDLYGNISISTEKRKQHVTPPVQPTPPPSKRGWNKVYLTIFSFFVLFFIYYGASSLIVPYLATEKLPQLFENETGCSLSIEKADFDPLTFSLIFSEVLITDTRLAEGEELLKISKMIADLDFLSLLRNNIVTEKLLIIEAVGNIYHYKDSSYNISPFLVKKDVVQSGSIDFAELPFLYSFNNIHITNSEILFVDINTQKKHSIENLEVKIPSISNISYTAKSYIRPHFSAVINGSPIELIEETSQENTDLETTSLSFRLKNLDIPLYMAYLPVNLPATITEGKVDGKIIISFPKKISGQHIAMNFQLELSDIGILNQDHNIILKAPSLHVEGNISPFMGRVKIARFLIRDPVLSVKHNFSLSSFLHTSKSEKNGIFVSQSKPTSVEIALLIADNGKISIERKGKENLDLNSIQLSIRNFQNTYSTALAGNKEIVPSSFLLNGETGNDFSTFNWQGTFTNSYPEGPIEINNIRLTELLNLYPGQNSKNTGGLADVRGHVTLTAPKNKKDKDLNLVFTDGIVHLTQPSLFHAKRKWFQASIAKLDGISASNNTVNIESVQIDNGDLLYVENDLPELVKIYKKKRKTAIQALNYNGRITLTTKKAPKSTLRFDAVKINLNNKTKKENKDNFSFSAILKPSGKITANGQVEKKLAKGSVKLSFADINLKDIDPWLSNINLPQNAESSASGKGEVFFTTKEFKGDIEVEKGAFLLQEGAATLSFSQGRFADFIYSPFLTTYSGRNWSLQSPVYSDENLLLRADNIKVSSLFSTHNEFKIGKCEITNGALNSNDSIFDVLHKNSEIWKKKHTVDSFSYNGKVTIDKPDKTKQVWEQVALQVDRLGDQTTKDNLTLSTKNIDGGSVQADGILSLQPVASKINIQFKQLPFQHIQPNYLFNDDYNLEAVTDGNLVFLFPEKSYRGSLSFTDSKLLFKNKDEIIQWDSGRFEDLSLTQKPYHLGISRITLEKPLFSIFQDTDQSPFSNIHKNITRVIPNSHKEKGSVLFSKIDIVEANLNDGVIHYHDKRISPPVELTLHDVNGKLQNFHVTPSTSTSTYSFNSVFNDSVLTSQGTIKFLNNQITENYTLQLQNFPLGVWSDHVNDYFTIDTEQSRFNLDFSFSTEEDGSAKKSASFLFKELKPRSIPSDESFILALLKDDTNTIKQRFSTSNVKTTLLNQTINHFQKVLIKTSVSPYLLLPSPFTELEGSNRFFHNPGELSLSEEAKTTLTQFGQLLQIRPDLNLLLKAQVNKESDRKVLLQSRIEEEKEKVRILNEKRIQEWKKEQIITDKNLQNPPSDSSIVVQDIPPEKLQSYTPVLPQPVAVTEKDLVQFGKLRMQEIIAYLSTMNNIDETRFIRDDNVFLLEDESSPSVEIVLVEKSYGKL